VGDVKCAENFGETN